LLVHTDAAQSLGKLRVRVEELSVDMLTIVGHKFGGPKGVAALWSREPPAVGLLHGGGQERARRAGTENVILLVCASFGGGGEGG
jgi:cysteine desulfurase